jgi:hypothetical protein
VVEGGEVDWEWAREAWPVEEEVRRVGVVAWRLGEDVEMDEMDEGIDGTGGMGSSWVDDPRRMAEKLNFLTSLTKELEEG